ncbi:MAG: hypothetical protein KAJ08_09925, partial [Deltaproteobacteria bacterium]|nr:hypothetical protein [Deltaproteobacteria bacterium]
MMKSIIQLLGGIAIIVGTLWYLAGQFASIDVQLTQVISTDIPKIKEDLDNNYEKTEQIRTNMDNIVRTIDTLGDQAESINKIGKNMDLLTDKIDGEIISEMNQLEMERKNNIKEVEMLSRKIDNLSRQYVKFLKLSKDKITVSIPPKWVDELPCRDGMIFNVGVSPSTERINEAQQLAVKQARSHMAIILKRKTINAIGSTIEAAGKLPPSAFDELSEQFKKQVNEAISELMIYSRIESYWV